MVVMNANKVNPENLAVVLWGIHLNKLMDGPITALLTLDCDWSVHKFIEVNFSKENNQIFRNDFDCIHYNLCKISSQIIERKIFAPHEFLELDSITSYSTVASPTTNYLSRIPVPRPWARWRWVRCWAPASVSRTWRRKRRWVAGNATASGAGSLSRPAVGTGRPTAPAARCSHTGNCYKKYDQLLAAHKQALVTRITMSGKRS